MSELSGHCNNYSRSGQSMNCLSKLTLSHQGQTPLYCKTQEKMRSYRTHFMRLAHTKAKFNSRTQKEHKEVGGSKENNS